MKFWLQHCFSELRNMSRSIFIWLDNLVLLSGMNNLFTTQVFALRFELRSNRVNQITFSYTLSRCLLNDLSVSLLPCHPNEWTHLAAFCLKTFPSFWDKTSHFSLNLKETDLSEYYSMISVTSIIHKYVHMFYTIHIRM